MKNREVEKKFIIKNTTVNSVVSKLLNIFEFSWITANTGTDYFFLPSNEDIDFIRLRKNSEFGEITIKSTDKGHIRDRLEINVRIEEAEFKDLLRMYKTIYGKPEKVVTKYYYTLFLEGHDNITVYKVDGLEGDTFLEVEAGDIYKVNAIIKKLPEYNYLLQDQSLFQLAE